MVQNIIGDEEQSPITDTITDVLITYENSQVTKLLQSLPNTNIKVYMHRYTNNLKKHKVQIITHTHTHRMV